MSIKRSKDIKSTRKDKGYRFTKAEKIQIVREVEEGRRRSDVCIRHGVAYGTLCEWMRELGSPLYLKGKNSKFGKAEKRGIVRNVIDGITTKEQACANYDISPKLLRYWISEFRKEEPLISEDAMPKTCHTPSTADNELAFAKLKIKALETLIDVAEEQFKISIRKKPGAKQ